MSDKQPDERNIDEILASIDEMLNQPDLTEPLRDDARKTTVSEAAKASEQTLNLHSTAEDISDSDSESLNLDDIDMDEFVSLGVEHESDTIAESPSSEATEPEPATNESPAEAEKTDDALETEATQEEHEEHAEEKPSEEETPESDTSDSEVDTSQPDTSDADVEEAKPDTVDFSEDESEDEAEDEQDEPVDEQTLPRQRILLTEALLEPSAQEALPLWVEQGLSEDGAAKADAKPNKPSTSADKVAQNKTKASKQAKPETTVESTADKDSEEAFDVSEDLGTDTVYPLEPLDEHTELVEAMMEEVLQEDEPEAEETEHTPELLSNEDLKTLVQMVSDDVATQVNDHLQTWLPGLISISIKKHLEQIRKNTK